MSHLFSLWTLQKHIMDLSLKRKLFANAIIITFRRCIAPLNHVLPQKVPCVYIDTNFVLVKLCWIELQSVIQHALGSVLTRYCPPYVCCLPTGKWWEMMSRYLSISCLWQHLILCFCLFYFFMKLGVLLKFFSARIWKNKVYT